MSAPVREVLHRREWGPRFRQEVRVFVSSTFADMQAERNTLVRHVFPQCRRHCEELGYTWSDVDLRWGITSEEKDEASVLPICLDLVSNSDVVIILLGERYGWIPEAGDLPAGFLQHYSWAAEYLGISATEMEIRQALSGRNETRPQIFAYFRAHPEPGKAVDPRLESLKAELRQLAQQGKLGLLESYRQLDELAARTTDDIRHWLLSQRLPAPPADPMAQETLAHEQSLQHQCFLHIDRPELLHRIDAAMRRKRPVLLTGEPGTGKTSLLCRWLERTSQQQTEPLGNGWLTRWKSWFSPVALSARYHAHLAHASVHASTWASMTYRLLYRLSREWGLPLEPPQSTGELCAVFPAALEQAAAQTTFILAVDGVDKLASSVAEMEAWLPARWPSSIRFIATAESSHTIEALATRGWTIIPVGRLLRDERRTVAKGFLNRLGKTLPPSQLDQIANCPLSERVMDLRIVLEECRQFGVYEELPDYLTQLLQCSSQDLLPRIVKRLSTEFDPRRPQLTRDFLTLVAGARHGLAEVELRELLGTPASPLPSALWEAYFASWLPALINRNGIWSFANEPWHELARSAGDLTLARQRLVQYFQIQPAAPRSVAELPWLLMQLQSWPELAAWFAVPTVLMRLWERSPDETRAILAVLSHHVAVSKVLSAYLSGDSTAPQAACIAAELLSHHGCYLEAIGLLKHAMPAQSGMEQAEAMGALAIACQKAGRLDEALTWYQEQFSHLDSSESESRAANRSNLAALMLEKGDAGQALGLLAEAEKLHHLVEGSAGWLEILGNRASSLILLGDTAQAEKTLKQLERQSRSTLQYSILQKCLAEQAGLLASRQPQRALTLLNESERWCEKLGNLIELQVCRVAHIRLLLSLGDFDAAHELSKSVLAQSNTLGNALRLPALQASLEVYARAGLTAPAELQEEAARLALQSDKRPALPGRQGVLEDLLSL